VALTVNAVETPPLTTAVETKYELPVQVVGGCAIAPTLTEYEFPGVTE
jgi:hypothetical protein